MQGRQQTDVVYLPIAERIRHRNHFLKRWTDIRYGQIIIHTQDYFRVGGVLFQQVLELNVFHILLEMVVIRIVSR